MAHNKVKEHGTKTKETTRYKKHIKNMERKIIKDRGTYNN